MHDHPSDPGDLAGMDPLSSDLLERFFAGDATGEEQARVRRYLTAHPDFAAGVSTYLDHLERDGDEEPPTAAESFARLRERLRAEAVRPIPSLVRGTPAQRSSVTHRAWPHRRTARWTVLAAASAVLAAGIAVFAVLPRRAPTVSAPAARIYATDRGQRAHLELADGTIVDMAPGSRLRVGGGFGLPRRDVYLDGEAYFTVIHDEQHPFTVYTASTVTRDIGTAFAVRSYAADHDARVVVREGRVSLNGAGLLAPGDVARLADGHLVVEHNANVDELLGWMRGDFTYRRAQLSTVTRDLSRWYGIDVAFAEPAIGAMTFTGSLTDMRSRDALELVAATMNLRVSRAGDRYVLARK